MSKANSTGRAVNTPRPSPTNLAVVAYLGGAANPYELCARLDLLAEEAGRLCAAAVALADYDPALTRRVEQTCFANVRAALQLVLARPVPLPVGVLG